MSIDPTLAEMAALYSQGATHLEIAQQYGVGKSSVQRWLTAAGYTSRKSGPQRTNPDTCVVEGCSNPSNARSLCKAHWSRWKRHGDPLGGGPAEPAGWRDRSTAQRIYDGTVVSSTGCWEWQQNRTNGGYGLMSIRNFPNLVHRVSYEEFVGQIPPGLQIDHLCRNRICCNPAHLEPVTPAENLRRARLAVTHGM